MGTHVHKRNLEVTGIFLGGRICRHVQPTDTLWPRGQRMGSVVSKYPPISGQGELEDGAVTRQQGVPPPLGSSGPRGSQAVGEPRRWPCGCCACPCAFPVTPDLVWGWLEPQRSAIGKSVPGRKGSCSDVPCAVTWPSGKEGRKQGDILGAHRSTGAVRGPPHPEPAASSILLKLVPPPRPGPASAP